jgi:hypothetical protein
MLQQRNALRAARYARAAQRRAGAQRARARDYGTRDGGKDAAFGCRATFRLPPVLPITPIIY